MIKKLRRLFGGTLYFIIWKDRIKVINLHTKATFDQEPLVAATLNAKGEKILKAIGNSAKEFIDDKDVEVINPFLHTHYLIHDMDAALVLLRYTLAYVMSEKNIQSPHLTAAVIHPIKGDYHPLLAKEIEMFKQLSNGIRAKDVILYHGKELDIDTFDFDEIKRKQRSR